MAHISHPFLVVLLPFKVLNSSMLFRIYKSVLAAVNKTQEGHPFRVSEIIPLRCEESSDIEWVRSLFMVCGIICSG